jgi:hypothetical protein
MAAVTGLEPLVRSDTVDPDPAMADSATGPTVTSVGAAFMEVSMNRSTITAPISLRLPVVPTA